MAIKKPSIFLPAGEAVWPHLNEIEVYQPVDKAGTPKGDVKRRYITKVRYNDADRAVVKQMLLDAAKKAMGSDFDPEVKLPFKKLKIKDTDGNVTGHEYLLEAKSGEKNRPGLFDAKRQTIPLTRSIGGGSKIKMKVTVNYYDGFGGGINLYIDQVQVLELVEGRSKECAFDEAEGYEVEEGADSEACAFDATDATEGTEGEGSQKDKYAF